MAAQSDAKQDNRTDNEHQKTVSGKKQRGPADRVGKSAGGNERSKGQNLRDDSDTVGKGGSSVGSHKPGGDGPGTKKFKHEHDDDKRREKN
jgi:hypothetical protein